MGSNNKLPKLTQRKINPMAPSDVYHASIMVANIVILLGDYLAVVLKLLLSDVLLCCADPAA